MNNKIMFYFWIIITVIGAYVSLSYDLLVEKLVLMCLPYGIALLFSIKIKLEEINGKRN